MDGYFWLFFWGGGLLLLFFALRGNKLSLFLSLHCYLIIYLACLCFTPFVYLFSPIALVPRQTSIRSRSGKIQLTHILNWSWKMKKKKKKNLEISYHFARN